jgi:hypothetical protein
MAEPFVQQNFKLTATIGGTQFDDVVSFSATFSLNDIPKASITVAVGYEARSNKTKKATIHDAKKNIKARDKVTVRLTMDVGGTGDRSKAEIGEFIIFEGIVAGLGYQRSHNSANYTIQLLHWLDDMNNSSALNGNWFPGAPHAMATNAAFYALTMSEGGAGGDQYSTVPAIDIDGNTINKGNAEKDLWGKIIDPLFRKIATYPLPDDGPNTAALAALDKIYAPTRLALDLAGLESTDIDLSLRYAMTKESLDSFAYTTFWNKLAGEYGPQFFFAVAPAIERARVIPFFAGLKWSAAEGKGGKIIKGDEYSYANFNASMTQFLESVIIFWPQQNDPMLGTGGEIQSNDSFSFPLASYPPLGAGADKPGLRLFKEPPTWLSNVSPWPIYSGATTGVKGKAPGDCMAPGEGEENPPPDWLPPPRAAEELHSSGICDRFAKHWYKSEVLSQRYGELSGKLRFDISPGTTVKIDMPINEIGSDGSMIGYVTQVSFSVNAERAIAGTSFALAFLRTEEEDNAGNYTETYPPLYKQSAVWGGGPLKGA